MFALTIWQPWAAAIAHGPKRIENRQWAPPLTHVGQRIAIHAGKSYDPQWNGRSVYELGITPDQALPWTGFFVALATLGGWVTTTGDYCLDGMPVQKRRAALEAANNDKFFVGPVGWVLTDVVALAMPIRASGAQRLWRVEPHDEVLLRAQDKGGNDAG